MTRTQLHDERASVHDRAPRAAGHLLVCVLVALLSACASNPYSYDREYIPRPGEQELLERAVPLSYEEIRRDPQGQRDQLVSWFGTVVDMQQRGPDTLLSMDLRFHQDRPLCRDQFDSSCRVTVSDRDGGPFSALVTLAPEDTQGQFRLGTGSLVRVYGHATDEFDERGGPILKAAYFRYWPHGTYVFTSNQNNMRQ